MKKLIFKKEHLGIALFFVLLLVMQSCNKEDAMQLDAPVYDTAIQNDIGIEKVAQSVASLMNDPEIRKAIRDKALLQLDADYDILLPWIENDPIGGKSTFGERLIEAFAQVHQVSTTEARNELDLIRAAIPVLQISVPIMAEEWDTENFIPLVAAEKYEKSYPDDKVTAFNSLGEKQSLPYSVAPEEPTVVVGLNERVDEKGNVHPSLIQEGQLDTKHHNAKQKRIDGQQLGIRIVYSRRSWKQLDEGWTQSKAEFKFSIIAPKASSTPWAVWIDVKKSDVKNNRWTCALQPAFNWWWASYGDFITFHVVEYDGVGTEESLSVSHKDPNTNLTTTATVKWKSGDEELGSLPIHKNDYVWQEYDTGRVKWYLTGPHAGGNACD